MDLMKIFKTDHDGIRRSHVKNLVTIAMADGHVDNDEWKLLVKIATRLGLSEEGINSIKSNPDAVSFVPPKNTKRKYSSYRTL